MRPTADGGESSARAGGAAAPALSAHSKSAANAADLRYGRSGAGARSPPPHHAAARDSGGGRASMAAGAVGRGSGGGGGAVLRRASDSDLPRVSALSGALSAAAVGPAATAAAAAAAAAVHASPSVSASASASISPRRVAPVPAAPAPHALQSPEFKSRTREPGQTPAHAAAALAATATTDSSDATVRTVSDRDGGGTRTTQRDSDASAAADASSECGHERGPTPWSTLVFITINFAGVQMSWALQFALTTPFFLELGIPQFWISFIWLCGPIMGLLVQPIVGFWSDRCTLPMGRRRPFLIAGTCLVVVAVALITSSLDIGRAAGSQSTAMICAVAGFWLLDLSNNTIQGPCRALLVDVATPQQQKDGSSLFSVFLGLGSIAGYAMGVIDWMGLVPRFQTAACQGACGNFRFSFMLGVSLLLLVMCLTITRVKERRWHPRQTTRVHPTTHVIAIEPDADAEPDGPQPHSPPVGPPLVVGARRLGRGYASEALPVPQHLSFRTPPHTPPPRVAHASGLWSEQPAPDSPVEVCEGIHVSFAHRPLPTDFRASTPPPPQPRYSHSLPTPTHMRHAQAYAHAHAHPHAAVPLHASPPAHETTPIIRARAASSGAWGPPPPPSAYASGNDLMRRQSAAPSLVTTTLESESDRGGGGGTAAKANGDGQQPPADAEHATNPFTATYYALVKSSGPFLYLCGVQFFLWFGWFAFLMFITDWMGKEVFGGHHGAPHGSPELAAYERGVRAGSLGMVYFSCATVVVSLALPRLMRLCGEKTVYSFGNAMLAVCALCTLFVHSEASALVLLACFGVPWAITMVVPYTLLARMATHSQGLSLGVMNLFICIPQIIAAFALGPLSVSAFGGSISATIAFGGVFSAFAACLVWRLPSTPVVLGHHPTIVAAH